MSGAAEEVRVRIRVGPEPDYMELRMVQYEDVGMPGDQQPTFQARRPTESEMIAAVERLWLGMAPNRDKMAAGKVEEVDG